MHSDKKPSFSIVEKLCGKANIYFGERDRIYRLLFCGVSTRRGVRLGVLEFEVIPSRWIFFKG